MKRSMTIAVSFSALASLVPFSRVLAQTLAWKTAVSGQWNIAGNWSPANVPDLATELANISTPGPYSINLDIPISISRLTIDNPSATLNIQSGGSLSAGGVLLNNGLIAINPDPSAGTASLVPSEGMTLTGAGRVQLNARTSLATSASIGSAALLTNNAGHTISGNGQITGNFSNRGLVDANSPGLSLRTPAGQWSNAGTARASNNGVLEIVGLVTQNSQGASGTILADNGTVILRGSPRVSSGRLSAVNGGRITTGNDAQVTLDTVTAEGTIELVPFANLILTGTSYTHNGEIIVNTGTTGGAKLTTSGTVNVSGDLLITMNSLPGRTDGADMLGNFVLGNAVVVHGRGGIGGGTMDSQGTFEARNGDEILSVGPTSWTNRGIVRALNGGVIALESTNVNQVGGRIIADGGQVILRGTISNGRFDAFNNGRLTTKVRGAATLNGVISTGLIEIPPSSSLTAVGAGIVHNGPIVVNSIRGADIARLNFIALSDIGSGPITLNAPTDALAAAVLAGNGSSPVDHAIGRSLIGNGNLANAHLFRGLVSPGTDLDPIGTIGGPGAALSFAPSSTVHIDIASPANFDRFIQINTFNMAGTLELNPLPSYTPALGDTITFINNTHPAGKFDRLVAPPLANPNWRWRVRYGLESVAAVVTCAADFDANDFVTGDDFDQYVQAFVNGEYSADFNNDGFVTADDFDAFSEAFRVGC